jgi:GNAT superfamily N-acetyltransferase
VGGCTPVRSDARREAPGGRRRADGTVTGSRGHTRIIARDGWYQTVTPSASDSLNEVLVSRVDDADVERVIDDVIATYTAIGRRTKWCVGPETLPADTGERLARRGFSSWATRGMGCDTSKAIAPGAVVTRIVANEADLDTYVQVSCRGWSTPEDEIPAKRSAYVVPMREGFLSLFLAELDGVCVGTGGVLLRERAGYLVGTSVVEAARRSGAYRALVAARLAWLRDRGIAYAVTHAREATSAPALEHLGFETLFRGRCYLST